MTRCALALSRETLSAWHSYLLTQQEQQQIAAHLPHCAVCQHTIDTFERIARTLRQDPVPSFSGQDVWDAVLGHILHEERGHMSTTRMMTTLAGVAAAALVVIFALVLTHSPGPMGGSPVISPTATRGAIASPSSVATQTATMKPTGTATTPSATPTPDPRSRIHNASPNYVPTWAYITFTATTTYDQAVAIIAPTTLYGENCDGVPRTPFPSNYPQMLFKTSHMLLIIYPTWDQLLQIAAASQVVSVDGTPLYPCP